MTDKEYTESKKEKVSSQTTKKQSSNEAPLESDSKSETVSELSELDKALKDRDNYYDSMLRATAEVENIKKRTAKEVENAYKYSIESILEQIIPIYDSLSLSCSHKEKDINKDQVLEGNKILLSMFQQLFEKNNILEINPINEEFNPDLHQAISTHEDKSKKNDVIHEVIQKGYMLNDRIIKPALVVVIKNTK